MNGNVKLRASDLMERMTLHVTITGVNVLRARIWIGSALIRLAARVMRCNIDIKA